VTGRRTPLVLAGLALAGLAISGYLTAAHGEKLPLVCPTNAIVNCASVTQSAYAVIPGTTIPIAVLGIVWFLISGVLSLVPPAAAMAQDREPGWLRPAHFAWAGLGLLAVLYLAFVEIVRLHQLCEWCTAVHLLVLASFLLTLYRLQRLPTETEDARFGGGRKRVDRR
jgi:uncharacterized membrane protein